MSRSRKHRHKLYSENTWSIPKLWSEIWDAFWEPPDVACPKCKSQIVEYYDPFLFSLLRTLGGRRRYRCTECRFVWRRSRSESILRRSGLIPRR